MRVKHAAPMALLAAAMAAGAAHAQVMTMTASASTTVSIDFDTTYNLDLSLDKFDTMGGTRQLVGIDLRYEREITGVVSWGANPLPADIASSWVGTSAQWWGDLDGVAIPYVTTPGHGNSLWSDSRWGTELDPGDGAGTSPVSGFSGYSDPGMNPTDDAALFAALTGSGQAFIDGHVDIGSFVDEQAFGALHDIIAPDWVWIPGLFTLELETYTVDITATYHYVMVPAPGAAGAMALCGVGLGVRRRRR